MPGAPSTNTPIEMHISPKSTASTPLPKAAMSGTTSPPPPSGLADNVDIPSVPNRPPGPAAIADGLFLTSPNLRPTAESQDFVPSPSAAVPGGTLFWAAPYIARSPMRATPATPTHNLGRSSHPDGSPPHLLDAADIPTVVVAPAPALADNVSLAAITQNGTRSSSNVSAPPAAAMPGQLSQAGIYPCASTSSSPSALATGPSSHPTHLRQQTLFELLAVAIRGLRESPRREVQAGPPTRFLISPGHPAHPIYVESTDPTPNGTPTPAQRPAGAANPLSVQRHHVSAGVQTDPVYMILSVLFEDKDGPAATPPSHRCCLYSSPSPSSSLSSSVESSVNSSSSSSLSPPGVHHFNSSPSPSPPARSLAATRIRRKAAHQPVCHAKVLTTSDEEYSFLKDYPQASSTIASTSAPVNTSTTAPATTTTTAPAPVHMTHTTTASTSAASASTSSTSAPPISPSNSSNEEYPEFLDFNNPAVANEVTQLLNEAAEALAKPQTDNKGKGVAR